MLFPLETASRWARRSSRCASQSWRSSFVGRLVFLWSLAIERSNRAGGRCFIIHLAWLPFRHAVRLFYLATPFEIPEQPIVVSNVLVQFVVPFVGQLLV